MYHKITLDMLVMTDNPPELTLEALTLFLMEQTQCIANVTVTPMVAQCTAMPFTQPPTAMICNNSSSNNPTPAPPPTFEPDTFEPAPRAGARKIVDHLNHQAQRNNSVPSPTKLKRIVEPDNTTTKEPRKRISAMVNMWFDDERISHTCDLHAPYRRYYSYSGSWISPRPNGRIYYYDSDTQRRGETCRHMRFRLSDGSIERRYTAQPYVSLAAKYGWGTRNPRLKINHVYLTIEEGKRCRARRVKK